MKQIVILTGYDLYQVGVNKRHNKENNYLSLEKIRIFVDRLTAAISLVSAMLWVATVAIIVAVLAAFDISLIGNDSTVSLAVAVVTGVVALIVAMWRDGYFNGSILNDEL